MSDTFLGLGIACLALIPLDATMGSIRHPDLTRRDHIEVSGMVFGLAALAFFAIALVMWAV